MTSTHSAQSFARIAVEPGAGLVGRFAGVVLLTAPEADGRQELTDELFLAAQRAAACDGAAGAVAELAAVLTRRFCGGDEELPAFGAVVAAADRTVVLLHGTGTARLSGPGGSRELSGGDAVTWVEHVVAPPVEAIAVTVRPGEPVTDDGRSDLRGGVAPAVGFVAHLLGGGGGAPPVIAEVPAPAAPVDVPAQAPVEAVAPAPVELLPTALADEVPPVAPPQGRAAEVRGTTALDDPVGVLVADDGSRILLDRTYVLGREPESDPQVADGSASPVVVREPDSLVSRVQARIWVEDGMVRVVDAGSANGTFVAAPGDADWTRLGADAVELPLGWSLRLGRRVFTLHAPLSQAGRS